MPASRPLSADATRAVIRPTSSPHWITDVLLGFVVATVIGVFFWQATAGIFSVGVEQPALDQYNRLTDGFRSGSLSLKRDVPSGLAQLPDPYDPVANAPYRSAEVGLHDVSYYQGRLYLYFGVTPVLIAFWPWTAITGRYLSQAYATAGFCSAGFVFAALLLRSVWRRFYPEVSVLVVAAAVAAVGLGSGVLLMLQRPQFYEVAVSSGSAMTLLSLAAVWAALNASNTRRRIAWTALASVACGLAVGSRPSLLFGALVLLIPIIQAARARDRAATLQVLLAACVPLAAIIAALAAYNALRFGDPFEFGLRYQLADERQATLRHCSLTYFSSNVRLYLFTPLRWIAHYPFVAEQTITQLPGGHTPVDEPPLGLLWSVPFVWLALAVPLSWRDRATENAFGLKLLAGAMLAVLIPALLLLCCFCTAANRYEVDFSPVLLLLAALGLLALERHMRAWSPGPRWAAHTLWLFLLSFSLATNVLVARERARAEAYTIGSFLLEHHRPADAATKLQIAVHIKPTDADAHNQLGVALSQSGRAREGISELNEAIRLAPDAPSFRLNLATTLAAENRLAEAEQQFQRVVQLDPNNALAQYNLGLLLANTARLPEADEHLATAVRLSPRNAEIRQTYAAALLSMNRLPEARQQLRELLRLRPGDQTIEAALGELDQVLSRENQSGR